jgi:hypothetical protein
MRSVFKSIAAVVAGFIVASIVMMIIEYVNGHIFYPALARAAQGVTDREQIRALFAKAPVSALFVVIVGWVLGGIAGGWTTARLAPRFTLRHALVLGALLTLAGVANNLMLPPPLWFWIASIVVFIPATHFGASLAPRR